MAANLGAIFRVRASTHVTKAQDNRGRDSALVLCIYIIADSLPSLSRKLSSIYQASTPSNQRHLSPAHEPEMFCLQPLLPFLAPLFTLTTATSTHSTYTYPTLTTTPLPSTNSTVLRALISNAPLNLYSGPLIADLFAFLSALNRRPPPKAVIFASANPSFWIDHLDLRLLQPARGPPDSEALLGVYVQTVHLLRSLPTIFIATGAGNEIAVQMDTRLAGPNARMGSLEVALDLIHGNGGAQFLTQLIGPGGAAEYLLYGQHGRCADGGGVWMGEPRVRQRGGADGRGGQDRDEDGDVASWGIERDEGGCEGWGSECGESGG
ncbi:hypothetical protein MMC18_008098 [Xylographa bjoerkii]|nr:hypothetical protein [Xylographa bjoerkii]